MCGVINIAFGSKLPQLQLSFYTQPCWVQMNLF